MSNEQLAIGNVYLCCGMQLERLTIFNFKNIRQAELEFSAGLNCFVGHNGEGKTNLLDAIYYLSFCRSHLSHLDSGIVRHGEEVMSLKGSYLLDEGAEAEVLCCLQTGRRKRFSLNGKDYTRLSKHIGGFPAVVVTPLDQNLIDGGSDGRRRFLDGVISQYDPAYLQFLIAYRRALDQRNSMLREDVAINDDLVAIYESQMAEAGQEINLKRAAMLSEFVPIFNETYRLLSGGGEEVGLDYMSCLGEGNDLADILRSERAHDKMVGFTTRGIHRDDLHMTLGGFPIKSEGSQGQRKTYVLGLKLAQFEFLKSRGERHTPLLLLDDIFDKLDSGRLERLLHMVASRKFGQIFITDTNHSFLQGMLGQIKGRHSLFGVEKGVITRETN